MKDAKRTACRWDSNTERNLGRESTGKGDQKDERTGGRTKRNTWARQTPDKPGVLGPAAGVPGAGSHGAPAALPEGC